MKFGNTIAGILVVLTFTTLIGWLAITPVKPEVELAGFATSLRGRTASQRHNAEKAARALDNQVIAPGAVFSFNKVVKSWSWDQGYVKAPVSYDGELIPAYGGGVCQASTTLYNAALLAGLPIVERHSHVFTPHYVPPGRDAAVAQITIDLRFRNPYPYPVRLRAEIKSDRLLMRIMGREIPKRSVQVTTDVLSVTSPQRLLRTRLTSGQSAGRTFLRNPGAAGYRVVTHRVYYEAGKEVRRERLSDDTYQAMNRLIQRMEGEAE